MLKEMDLNLNLNASVLIELHIRPLLVALEHQLRVGAKRPEFRSVLTRFFGKKNFWLKATMRPDRSFPTGSPNAAVPGGGSLEYCPLAGDRSRGHSLLQMHPIKMSASRPAACLRGWSTLLCQ